MKLTPALLALLTATACADSVVVFNEVHYHPESAEASLEYLELHNQMTVDVDLSGWAVTGGVNYTFPANTVIPGRGYLVVAVNPVDLLAAAGVTGALGPWTGRLSNSGEDLHLRDNLGREMDEVVYGSDGKWPVGADGAGPTLAKRTPDAASGDPANWTISWQHGGTPGAVNFGTTSAAPPSLEIHETGAPGSWFVELRNTGTAALDLAGYVLRTTGTTGGSYTLPAQTMEPGALLSLPSAQTGLNPAAGQKVFLATPGSVQFVDGVEVATTGRGRTTAGAWAVVASPTPGAANAFAFHDGIVISEIMYHPRPTPGAPAQIQDLTLVPSTATWRYSGNGTDPGAGWQEAGYNDSAWPAGQGMLASAATGGGYAAAVAADTPRAYWKLDDPTTVMTDASGNGRTGTATAGVGRGAAALVGDGDASRAITLSGSNRITVPGFEKIGPGGYSAEYWVKVVSAPGGFMNLVGDGDGTDFFMMNYLSAGMAIRPHYSFANSPVSIDSTGLLAVGQTYHIVTTWSASDAAGNGVIYLNGVPNTTATITRNLPAAGTTGNNMVFIGYDNREPASGSYVMDEVALYNYPLSAARVAAHYQAGSLPGPRNTALATGASTHYFRTSFTFSGNPSATALSLTLAADDGAAVYLNGTALHRDNLPDGPLTHGTPASAERANALLSGPFAVPAAALRNGVNVIAVSVHQAGSNPDVFMGLELTARETLASATPFTENRNTWLELHNKSASPVDLTGWSVDDSVDFAFAPGTSLAAGARLVAARDPLLFAAAYPGVAAVGPLTNQFPRGRGRIVLRDANGNTADTAVYHDRGRWPTAADGGGSSLELRDLRSDNTAAESWAASDESSRAAWQTYTYRAAAAADGGPVNFNEFVLGLLDEGEVLLDDLVVTSQPGTGSAAVIVAGGTFSTGAAAWRMRGTHRTSAIIAEPGNAGNQVLRVTSTGGTDVLHNCIEITLNSNSPVVDGREYEISFRAKWVRGANLLNTRFYWNRCARVTPLQVPVNAGTPGAVNSRNTANTGPAFANLRHSPVMPAATQACIVRVEADDPDNVTGATLFYAVAGGAWQTAAMSGEDGTWSAPIPGQSAGTVVQCYVRATDGAAATADFPAAGENSRALIQWNNNQANTALAHNVRLIMTAADRTRLFLNTNLMADDRIGCTVVYDENEVFYGCGLRLKGSEHGRADSARQGYHISFPAEQKFRGVHSSVLIDRSGGWRFGRTTGQDEILVKHIISHAGGAASLHDDIIRVISPQSGHTGPALLQMARYGGDYLDSMYQNGSDGPLYKLEIAYHTTATDGGLPSGLKQAQESSISNFELGDRGADPERYRWIYRHENNPANDDFAPIMAVTRAFAKSGTAFDAAIDPLIDNEQWMRTMAFESLCGISDIFSRDNGHNANFYQRPKDGKMLLLPWDWDFSFVQGTTAPLWGGRQAGKLIQRPHNLRLFYGHLQDIMATTFNTAYMAYWTNHYDNFTPGQDFSGILTWIGQRATYVQNQIPPAAAWALTTAPAPGALISTASTSFAGTAPYQYQTIRFETPGCDPVEATFSSLGNWSATLPVTLGRHLISLRVLDPRGVLIPAASQDFVVIGTSATTFADTDADGLPDAWECETGLDAVATAKADGDEDGDGQNNLHEYLAGTHPLNAGSTFTLSVLSVAEDSVTVSFLAAAGRTYRIQSSPSLTAGSWATTGTIGPLTTDQPVQSVFSTAPEDLRLFFRVLSP